MIPSSFLPIQQDSSVDVDAAPSSVVSPSRPPQETDPLLQRDGEDNAIRSNQTSIPHSNGMLSTMQGAFLSSVSCYGGAAHQEDRTTLVPSRTRTLVSPISDDDASCTSGTIPTSSHHGQEDGEDPIQMIPPPQDGGSAFTAYASTTQGRSPPEQQEQDRSADSRTPRFRRSATYNRLVSPEQDQGTHYPTWWEEEGGPMHAASIARSAMNQTFQRAQQGPTIELNHATNTSTSNNHNNSMGGGGSGGGDGDGENAYPYERVCSVGDVRCRIFTISMVMMTMSLYGLIPEESIASLFRSQPSHHKDNIDHYYSSDDYEQHSDWESTFARFSKTAVQGASVIMSSVLLFTSNLVSSAHWSNFQTTRRYLIAGFQRVETKIERVETKIDDTAQSTITAVASYFGKTDATMSAIFATLDGHMKNRFAPVDTRLASIETRDMLEILKQIRDKE